MNYNLKLEDKDAMRVTIRFWSEEKATLHIVDTVYYYSDKNFDRDNTIIPIELNNNAKLKSFPFPQKKNCILIELIVREITLKKQHLIKIVPNDKTKLPTFEEMPYKSIRFL